MILSAIAAKMRQCAKADFKGRHYKAALIVQAVAWYLRYPLSYRNIVGLTLVRSRLRQALRGSSLQFRYRLRAVWKAGSVSSMRPNSKSGSSMRLPMPRRSIYGSS